MEPVSPHGVKTHLSSLVERAAAGEESFVAKDGIPMARLVPLPKVTEPRRPAGALGITHIAPDFDAAAPAINALFDGRP